MTPRRALLALSLVLAPAGAGAAEPYDIHVVLPLTGGAAFLGTSEQVALQRAEPLLNKDGGIGGRPVRFVFHDDQTSPQVAVQLVNQVKATKPAIMLGSATVAMCNAMNPLTRRGPVMFCLSPGFYPEAGSFGFSSSNSTRDLAAALLRYFVAKNVTRVALITSTDASGQDAQRQIREVLADPANTSVQLVSETSFNPTDVSASAQIGRIKGAEPQAIIAWSTGAAIGTVFKAIKDAGITVPVATTDGNMTFNAMRQFADVLPDTLLIPSPEWPKTEKDEVPPAVRAAKDAFFAAFVGSGTEPDAASSFAWDPALLAVAALKAIGPAATADQVRDHLARLQGFAGVNGLYDFPKIPQRGLDDSNVVVTRWDRARGNWTIVSHARGVPLD